MRLTEYDEVRECYKIIEDTRGYIQRLGKLEDIYDKIVNVLNETPEHTDTKWQALSFVRIKEIINEDRKCRCKEDSRDTEQS